MLLELRTQGGREKGSSLTPNELIKYIEVVEDYKISKEAMVLIAQYCVNSKGQNINSNYILTVAKAWANEGIKSIEQVELKLKEMEAQSENMRAVFFALGLKSLPDFEDKQYLISFAFFSTINKKGK